MKAAVCLHGYFDSLKDPSSKGIDGYQHLKKNVLDKIDCDIYIHSWDLANEKLIKELYGIENIVACIFEPQIDFSSFDILEPQPGRPKISRILSQLYSVSKSISLVNLTAPKTYDWVIKSRFDIGRINRLTSGPHNPNLPYPVQCINFDPTLDPTKFYVANWQFFDTEGPPDMWFYSNQENMSILQWLYIGMATQSKIGSHFYKWAGDYDGGIFNIIKFYKWFFEIHGLWDIKVPLDTTWE